MTSRCSTHARARAAWKCQSCEQTLCLECAAEKATQTSKVTLCVLCGGFAQPIMKPREIAPFWAMFPTFAKAIFSSAGLVQILAIAIVQWMCSFAGIIGSLVSTFIYVSYYFRVIASAAQGGEKLPDPDDFLGLYSIIAPVARFFLAASVIFGPALAYVLYDIGFLGLLEDPTQVVRSPIVILSAVLAVVYFPAAIIAAAIAESALAVINPMITVRMILRIPGQYALATALWAVLTVVDAIMVNGMTAAAQAAWVPVLTPVMLNMIALVVPIFTGFMLGRLIYQNHEHFGVMLKGQAEEPEWAGAVPAGKLREAPVAEAYGGGVAEPVPSAWSPSGLELDVPVVEPKAPEPIDLGPEEPIVSHDFSERAGADRQRERSQELVEVSMKDKDHVIVDSGEESGLELDLEEKPAPAGPKDVPYLFQNADPRAIELDLTSEAFPEPSAPRPAFERSAPLELDLENALEPSSVSGPLGGELELDLGGPMEEAKIDLAPPPEVRARSTREIELDLGGAIELDDGEVPLSAISPRTKAKTDDLSLDMPKPKDFAKSIPKVITGAKLDVPIAKGVPIPKVPTQPKAPIPVPMIPKVTTQPKAMPKLLLEPAEPPPPPLPPKEPGLEELKSALERGDEAMAYELFSMAALGGSYPDLEPRLNLRLAGILEKVAMFDEAVRACQRAAKADMKGAFAAKAIFTAGRIMSERSGNRDGAKAMYEFLVKSFPSDDLAIRAKEALRKLA